MEIERKFLIISKPENLEQYTCCQIEQAYLCTAPVIRIRRWNEDYFLTYKSGGLMTREEVELPLNETAYDHLLKKADGRIIQKERFLIPYCTWTIELDQFHGDFEGLFMAEVEFKSEKEAKNFQKPEWFGKEVTFDGSYHNSYMSRCEKLPNWEADGKE